MNQDENIETNESFVEIQGATGNASSGYPSHARLNAHDYTYSVSSQLTQSHFGASHVSLPHNTSAVGSHAGRDDGGQVSLSQMISRPAVVLQTQGSIYAEPGRGAGGHRTQLQQRVAHPKMRGLSAQGVRNQTVAGQFPVRGARAKAGSPQPESLQSRLVTHLSETQKLKASNPFTKESASASIPQETYEHERLRTTLAHTQQQTITQPGPFDFTKSALGLTHRLLQAFTSPSPTANGHRSQAQNSPATFQFNPTQNTQRGGQLLCTTRFVGAVPSGQTVETQPSRVSVHRVRQHASPQPQSLTQPRGVLLDLLSQLGAQRQQTLKSNIERIVQNNIKQTDLSRIARQSRQATNWQLEEMTIQQRYDENDSKRAMQLTQDNQPDATERLMYEYKNSFQAPSAGYQVRDSVWTDQSGSPAIKVARVETDSRSSSVPDGDSGDQIQHTLNWLQSQSPFKDLSELNPGLQSRRKQPQPTVFGVDISTSLSSVSDAKKSASEVEMLDIGLEDIKVGGSQQQMKERHNEKQRSGNRASKAGSPSGSTTERQTMRGNAKELSNLKTPESRADAPRAALAGKQASELDEQHKFFNLLRTRPPTLAQQIAEGMKKSERRKHFKAQASFVESSHPSSSFDSINPADLVMRTQTATSNYASGASGTPATAAKFKQLQPLIQHGVYLQTRSSAYSSVYQLTRGDEDGHETGRDSYERQEPEAGLSGVERCLLRIDHNLNTFTTKQFEELRDKVKTMGFSKAQFAAQQHFGLKQPPCRV